MLGETTWLTAAELSATWAAIKDLVLKFADRDRDPSRRPEGAREVRLFAASSVAPQRAVRGLLPRGARQLRNAHPPSRVGPPRTAALPSGHAFQ